MTTRIPTSREIALDYLRRLPDLRVSPDAPDLDTALATYERTQEQERRDAMTRARHAEDEYHRERWQRKNERVIREKLERIKRGEPPIVEPDPQPVYHPQVFTASVIAPSASAVGWTGAYHAHRDPYQGRYAADSPKFHARVGRRW